MNSKSLIALMLSGALCLTACVKDIESDSVAKVRDAKAQELASITALNNANAAAATLLANAEAALMNAEAAAKAAEADRIAAETEMIRVQTELAAVEVEIAQVKLEQEKVELEKKKAELEALLVVLEADKAEAELRKEKAAAEMERLAIEVETQMLRAQAELLKAQKEYNKIANDLDNDGLITLANAYYSASYDLYAAQSELAQLKISLSALENGLVEMNEAKAKTAIANRNEIAHLEVLIANLEAKQSMSLEELQAAELAAYEEKLNAYDAYVAAGNAYNEAYDELEETFSECRNHPYVTDLRYISVPEVDIHPEYYYDDEEEVHYINYYFNNDEGERVDLYSLPRYKYVPEEYPGDDESITHNPYPRLKLLPAKANAARYTELMALSRTRLKENYDAQVESYNTTLESYKYYADVAAAELEVLTPLAEEYEAALDAAQVANDDAYKAYVTAYRIKELYKAQNLFADDVEAKEAINAAKLEYEDAESHYEELFWPYYNKYNYPNEWEKTNVESNIRWSEENVAMAEGTLKQYQTAEYTAQVTAAEKAVADAQKAADAQQAVVDTKTTAVETAEAAERAAMLAYYANPTEANQTAWDTAIAARDKAYQELSDEDAKLQPLLATLENATADYNALVNNKTYAEENLAYCQEQLAEYEARLEELELVLAAYETMTERLDAWNELSAQYVPAEQDDEKYLELQEACDAAWDAYYPSSYNDYWDALNELNDFDSRYGYSDKLANYESYQDEVERIQEQIDNLTKEYEDTLEGLAETEESCTSVLATEAEYTALVADVLALDEAALEAYFAMCEASDVFSESSAEYEAIQTALFEETNLAETIEFYKSEIDRLQAEIDYVLDIESQEAMVEYTKGLITALETKIKVLEQKVAEAKDALDAATAAVTE